MADVRTPGSTAGSERSAAAQATATFVWTCVWLGCWAAVAAAVFLTVTRAFDVSRAIRVVIAHGVAPYLYFVVWPVAALAAWRHKWILTGAALALIAVQMFVTLPAVWPQSTPSWAARAPKAHVLVANVKEDNDRKPEAARALLAQDADVIVLVEMNDSWRRALVAAGIDARYPNQILKVDGGGGRGAAFYSRLPIAEGPSIDLLRGRLEPSAIVTLDGGTTVTVVAIHTVSPQSRSREERWSDNIDRLAAGARSIPGPYVLAGDFNATRWHPHFGRLLDDGLTDAHEHEGMGLTRSWPADGRHHLPPVMRLDHALMNGSVTSTGLRDIDVPGSDHRGFVVDLAVKPG